METSGWGGDEGLWDAYDKIKYENKSIDLAINIYPRWMLEERAEHG